MTRFIHILQFLTRIKVSENLPFDEEFHKGIIYFPLVGMVLGFFYLVLYRTTLFLGHSLAVLLTLTGTIFLTGGLHLDGLGDTFDGFYSNRPKEKILEIMKDSRLGTNGLVAIVMVLLLKAGALMGLQGEAFWIGLVYMPIAGRTALALGMYGTQYARESGMGHVFIGKVSRQDLYLTLMIAAGLMVLKPVVLGFMVPLYLITVAFKGHANHKIGGMTGDTLGALCELSELAYLLYLAGIWRWM